MVGRFNFRGLKLQEWIFPTLNVNLEALAALAMMADRKVSPDNVKSSEKLSLCYQARLDVSKNRGTSKSFFLIGFSIINHPFWGKHPYFWKHLDVGWSGWSGRWLSCGKLWKMGSRVWLAHKGAFALMDVMTNQWAFAGFPIACINTSQAITPIRRRHVDWWPQG